MEDHKKIPIIVILGPTASGKTKFSINMAKKYDGEIISADSMQIYKGMDIATATPTTLEMGDVPHHLISFLDLEEKFSVADYLLVAHEKAKEIFKKGKRPILAGGTGLYIDNFLSNTDFFDFKIDEKMKKDLEKRAEIEGGKSLLSELSKVDEELAKTLHENQHDRIIRGLLVYDATKKPLSFYKKISKLKESPYNFVIIGLCLKDRQKLYDNINKRVDIMVKSGLVQEAEEHFSKNHSITSRAAIGHKELHPYLLGKISKDEAISNLKQATRRYAKRQLTWFRKNKDINWIYTDTYKDYNDILEAGYKIIDESKIFD